MSYKTVLVHCDGDKPVAQRISIAADLAGRFGSHLVGLHVTPPFSVPTFVDTSFSVEPLMEAYQANVEADREAATGAFTAAMKQRSISSEWRLADGHVADEVIVQSRYADLVVVGQSNPESWRATATPPDLAETVALATGRPVLVVPYVGTPKPVGKTVMLCWNASRESARAASEALPLLRDAEKVVVLTIDARPSSGGHGAEPGADVASWLTRHGVKVGVQRDRAYNVDVGDVILSRAADLDADLIVMGVYGHSRAREFVLGGASRTLLRSMTVPVLMAH
jgi:nucleotide-binding universal stress UspA family protein